MSDWRDLRREAREIVHTTMALDMKFYQDATAEPVDVRARLHSKFSEIGDDRSSGWAEIQAIRPRLIFMLADLREKNLRLERNAVVFVQPGEAYNLGSVQPSDNITITVEVTRLTKRDYDKMGLPPAGDGP